MDTMAGHVAQYLVVIGQVFQSVIIHIQALLPDGPYKDTPQVPSGSSTVFSLVGLEVGTQKIA